MKVIYWSQPEEIKLGDIITRRLAEDFDEMWMVAGFTKDSGLEVLLPAIESSTIPKKNMDLGIDKKNVSKDALLKLLKAGVHLRVFANQAEDKVETRIYAFIQRSGTSCIYIPSGKLSEGGLFENTCIVTEIIYTAEESKEVEMLVEKLRKDAKFKAVQKEDIVKLSENGEIMARITERKIPRISELYQHGEIEIGVKQYDEGAEIGKHFAPTEMDEVEIEVDLPTED